MLSLYSVLTLAVVTDFGSVELSLLFSVGIIDVSNNSIISIKDSCDLLQRRPFGLNVEEIDKHKLDRNPDL